MPAPRLCTVRLWVWCPQTSVGHVQRLQLSQQAGYMEPCLKCLCKAIKMHGLGWLCGSELGWLHSTHGALGSIPSTAHRHTLGWGAVSGFLNCSGCLYSSPNSVQTCIFAYEVKFNSEVIFFLSLRLFSQLPYSLLFHRAIIFRWLCFFFFSSLPGQKKKQTILCPCQLLLKSPAPSIQG